MANIFWCRVVIHLLKIWRRDIYPNDDDAGVVAELAPLPVLNPIYFEKVLDTSAVYELCRSIPATLQERALPSM